jgi:hypothetical protein
MVAQKDWAHGRIQLVMCSYVFGTSISVVKVSGYSMGMQWLVVETKEYAHCEFEDFD